MRSDEKKAGRGEAEQGAHGAETAWINTRFGVEFAIKEHQENQFVDCIVHVCHIHISNK